MPPPSPRLRAIAFTAWIIGAGVATLSHYFVPGSVDAIVGIVVASVVFWSYEKFLVSEPATTSTHSPQAVAA